MHILAMEQMQSYCELKGLSSVHITLLLSSAKALAHLLVPVPVSST